jgi:flagellar secretion chaperone FliS
LPAQNSYKNYQGINIQTASPERLLLFIYEQAVKNLKAARMRHASGDLIKFRNHLFKTHTALMLLITSLNHEVDEKFSRGLESLYWYMVDQIDRQMVADTCQLDDVLRMLEELKASWETAYQNLLKEQPDEINENEKVVMTA